MLKYSIRAKTKDQMNTALYVVSGQTMNHNHTNTSVTCFALEKVSYASNGQATLMAIKASLMEYSDKVWPWLSRLQAKPSFTVRSSNISPHTKLTDVTPEDKTETPSATHQILFSYITTQ